MLTVSGATGSAALAIALGLVAATGVTAEAGPARRLAEAAPAVLAAPVGYPAGVAPNDVLAGDLDADGDPDLVVANKDTGHVSVLVGDGDGTLGAPVAHSVAPGFVQSVALGDLDPETDTDPDLVVMNPDEGQTDDVAVLAGAAGATFGPAADFAGDSDEDGWYEHQPTVAMGDFNQDGDQDLALGSANFRNLTILVGGPGRSFGAPTDIPLDNGSQGMTPVVGDFNQDGDPDLAVERSDRVSILLGGPGATFGPHTDYPLGYSAMTVVTGDFDGDEDPDLATVGWDPGTVSVLMGGPGGTFEAPVSFPSGGSYSVDLAAGDLNGDDVTDLVVASMGFTDTGGVSVHHGAGDGTFGPAQSYPANPRPYAVTLTDLDGDSDRDVVVTNRGGGEFYPDQVSVLRNDSAPADTTPPDTSISAGPEHGTFVLSEDATLEAQSTEPGSTFACSLDGTAVACPDGAVELSDLAHRTHQLTVAATDPGGNTDPSPATRTWTVPLDDVQLAADRHWTRKQASGGYLAGYSQASRKGATLSRKVEDARVVALVATKAPGHGKVTVYAGKKELRTVSLAAATRRTGRLVPVATLAQPFTGTLRVVVATAGKQVRVEGLGVAT